MKDRYWTEIAKGDKVVYISKSYGHRCLNSACLGIGIVSKVTPKTVTINKVNLKDNQIIENTAYSFKLVSNCYGGNDWDSSDAVMVIDKFPKTVVDYLSYCENKNKEVK